MSDDPKPLDDLQKGLSLLFRAAKTTVKSFPTQEVERAVVSGAREVARVIEGAAGAIDEQVFKRKGSKDAPPSQTRVADEAPPDPAHSPPPKDPPEP